MTGNEIKTSIEKFARTTLTPEDTLLIINEAIDKINDKGLVFRTVEVNAEPNTWYEMPLDCTSIIDVQFMNGQEPCAYYGWKLEGNQIRFKDANTYTIYARRIPEHLTDLTLEPDVHPLYHSAIVTFGRGFAKCTKNDESIDGHKKMDNDFPNEVLSAFNTLRRKRGPMAWKVIRHA